MLSWLKLDTSNSELVRAQLDAYSRLVPVLYLILLVNAVSISLTHYGYAPNLLTLVVPALLISMSIMRLISWVRLRGAHLELKQVIVKLRMATITGGILGLAFFFWVTALHMYGTDETRGHLSVVVGITGIAAVFSMMHVKPAAIVVAVLLAVPYSAFLAMQGVTEGIIGLNLALAILGVLYILKLVSADFRTMVLSQIESKRLSDDNLRLANRDNLTDLPNRRLFFNALEVKLATSLDQRKPLAIGVIDLDGFKPVNDTYGHVAGDQVLREVGRRLSSFETENYLIARLGGDEFGIICTGNVDDDTLLDFGTSICVALREPFILDELTVHISASVGFAKSLTGGDSAMQVYERADYALYFGKQNDRGSATLFDQSHETAISRTMRIEQALRAADLDKELSLQFQPMIDVREGKTVGFEALARWNSPSLGLVSPGEFIPVAEKTECIHAVTHCLLRKALKEAATWDDDLIISFNLSVRDLLSPRSILQIVSIVHASKFKPSRIDFEVTETALMSDFPQAQQSIRLLKAMGSRLSLDDFGTGYSSLSHVHRLPFDKIKNDRSFVTDIENAGASQMIVRSMIELCRSLDISCVVEGMETEGQTDILRRLGCDGMQGYFFSKPLDPAAVSDFLGNELQPEQPLLPARRA